MQESLALDSKIFIKIIQFQGRFSPSLQELLKIQEQEKTSTKPILRFIENSSSTIPYSPSATQTKNFVL